jgi:hypothetical protein
MPEAQRPNVPASQHDMGRSSSSASSLRRTPRAHQRAQQRHEGTEAAGAIGAGAMPVIGRAQQGAGRGGAEQTLVPEPEQRAPRRAAAGAVRRARRVQLTPPARPLPSSIFLDKNRRDLGKSQSIWTASKMEAPGSQLLQRLLLLGQLQAAEACVRRQGGEGRGGAREHAAAGGGGSRQVVGWRCRGAARAGLRTCFLSLRFSCMRSRTCVSALCCTSSISRRLWCGPAAPPPPRGL